MMKAKLQYIRLLALLVFMLLALPAMAQRYDVDFKDTPIEQVLKTLKKQTGYDFVAQRRVLEGIGPITCSYRDATLEQILERVIYQEAQLQYEIVKKTVVLSRPKKQQAWFKRLVTGIVQDEDGQPLVGVAVRLRGTETAVVTDLDGQFTLMVEGRQPVLDFTCMGMKPVQQPIAEKTLDRRGFLLVTMYNDVRLMDEVLVTGYQNIKRESATGSYQLVTAEQLEKRYTGDVLGNLEGRVPGLVKYGNGMSEDGEGQLTIRGTGSFQAKTNPLVVVDGLPIEGGLNSVNPYNIGTITVLKDAAAASIYGARASNGVIVITTKRANDDRLTVDFNADLQVSQRPDYSAMGWASAAQVIELERYNFGYISTLPNQSAYKSLLSTYQSTPYALSPVMRLLMDNHTGLLSTSDMEAQLSRLSRNDYRREWRDLMERNQVTHQYNVSLRNRGKYLNNSVVLNYRGDNQGTRFEGDHTYTLGYRGEMELSRWFTADFGLNLISRRQKEHIASEWSGINGFMPYMSMYADDGSPADMEAGALLSEPALLNNTTGLKSESYRPLDEARRNFQRLKENNLRTYLHGTLHLLEGWNLSAMFQYEDITSKQDAHYEADSYEMRHLYNLYTDKAGQHHMPDAGLLRSQTAQGDYYTLRTQTDYSHTFAQKHELEALAGFEYRQTRYTSQRTALVGYDDASQTNNMGTTDFGRLKDMEGTISALGKQYTAIGAPGSEDFTSSDVLHRYYSLYMNANYVYDNRYTASASYRVDKTDLFGADPKFRGRPLWSVGLGWNIQNEAFMKDITWLDALKLRVSYGLTGNIDQNVSSYLTANIHVNELYGNRAASLNTPPNDQLRWEKTASFNLGLDIAILKGRLSAALDVYRKQGSDLLTVTDLDPTTGWESLTINNGKALNRGVELQLNGVILQPRNRNALGINASLSFSYNHNEVTSVNHEATSGSEALSSWTLHQGYPIHALFSYRYAGMKNIKGVQYFGWIDHLGETHYSDTNSEEFRPEDAVYSGSLDPRFVASFTPELTWRGFTLSALLCYYGGHVMRAATQNWSYEGGVFGYTGFSEIEAVPAAYLNYWQSTDPVFPPNGYAGGANVVGSYHSLDASVVPADYIKLRTLSLSYQLPRTFVQRLRMRQASLRLQLNNVCTWTRNKMGIDPEACSPVSGDLLLPTPRSYTISLQATF